MRKKHNYFTIRHILKNIFSWWLFFLFSPCEALSLFFFLFEYLKILTLTLIAFWHWTLNQYSTNVTYFVCFPWASNPFFFQHDSTFHYIRGIRLLSSYNQIIQSDIGSFHNILNKLVSFCVRSKSQALHWTHMTLTLLQVCNTTFYWIFYHAWLLSIKIPVQKQSMLKDFPSFFIIPNE